jgi:hypothetical protein
MQKLKLIDKHKLSLTSHWFSKHMRDMHKIWVRFWVNGELWDHQFPCISTKVDYFEDWAWSVIQNRTPAFTHSHELIVYLGNPVDIYIRRIDWNDYYGIQ